LGKAIEINELFGIAERQWSKERGIDRAKRGDRDANAKAQEKTRGRCYCRFSKEPSYRSPQIP
jgi:hypothetical protein